jgi:hypothetical protein
VQWNSIPAAVRYGFGFDFQYAIRRETLKKKNEKGKTP